jgi:hypothetical protein
MLAISAAVAVGASVLGTLISFHIDGATGPCIVLIQSTAFLAAFLFAPKNGLMRRRTHGAEQARTGAATSAPPRDVA